MSDPKRPEPEPDPAADADWLRGDDPADARSERRRPGPGPGAGASADGAYDLADPGEEDEGAPAPAAAPRRAAPPVASWEEDDARPSRRRDRDDADEDDGPEGSDRVDEVWTRGAEWGPSLAAIGGAGAATLVVAYLALGSGGFGLMLLALTVGGLAMVALAYPLMITMERPLRMTPEHAVRDYFAALAHHRPHYRRMWLLLSNAGRLGGRFGSFPGFREYWERRLAELKGGKVSKSTPLVFEIKDFAAESSKGRRRMTVRYNVEVHARGQRSAPPLATIAQETPVVRGPDNMWYLGRGTL